MNQKTYVTLFGCFSHSFDINQIEYIWINDIDDINIKYDKYIIATIVDSYSRCGYINKAYQFVLEYEKYIENKYFDEIMWTCLLSGCRTYNNYLLAQHIYSNIIKRFNSNQSFIREMHLLYNNVHCSST